MSKDLTLSDVHIMDAGCAPVISAICHDLGVPSTINANVHWDELQCNLAPGTLAMALIINILQGRQTVRKQPR